MQPIPLPPIVEEPHDGLNFGDGTFVLGLVLLLIAAVAFALGSKHEKGPGKEIGAIAGLCSLAFILLGGVSHFATPRTLSDNPIEVGRQSEDHDRLVQKAVEKEYGLKITKDQAEALFYPEWEPEKDFEVYGSFTDRRQAGESSSKPQTIYLVWLDGKLSLSQSNDGKTFTPLTLAKKAE